jgi:hypothetical protein
MDFQGPYPQGEYIFVMIDRYTRWPEAKIMGKAPTAGMTMKAMTDIFTNKGVPELCQSDNGPPFQSQEMADFARDQGYEHKHVTPEWPRANGMVERFNRTMKEAVQAAHLEGKGTREAAKEFLGVYRATPHSATNISPYAAMHGGRNMKTTLPMITPEGRTVDQEKEKKYKAKMANARGGEEHNLRIGDKVLMKQKKQDKLTPRYKPVELTVTGTNGSSVTVTDGYTSKFRDASFFKRIESEDEEEPTPETPMPETSTEDDANTNAEPQSSTVEEEGDDVTPPEAPVQMSLAEGREKRTCKRPVWLADYSQ